MCGCTSASCDVRSQCASGTNFGSNLQCACVRCIFRLTKCDRNIAHFLVLMKEMTIECCLILILQLKNGGFYNFLTNKSIFGKLLGRYWDLKQCLKAKILNQILVCNKVVVASCDHQKSKLSTVVEGFWVAELRVREVKIGRKSCFDIFHAFHLSSF